MALPLTVASVGDVSAGPAVVEAFCWQAASALRTLARVARYPLMGSLVRRILESGWPYTRSSGVVRTCSGAAHGSVPTMSHTVE